MTPDLIALAQRIAQQNDQLLQAISAAGMGGGLGTDLAGALGGFEEADELTPWNRTEVKVPLSKRPALFDKARTLELSERGTPQLGEMIEQAPQSMAPYAALAG